MKFAATLDRIDDVAGEADVNDGMVRRRELDLVGGKARAAVRLSVDSSGWVAKVREILRSNNVNSSSSSWRVLLAMFVVLVVVLNEFRRRDERKAE